MIPEDPLLLLLLEWSPCTLIISILSRLFIIFTEPFLPDSQLSFLAAFRDPTNRISSFSLGISLSQEANQTNLFELHVNEMQAVAEHWPDWKHTEGHSLSL